MFTDAQKADIRRVLGWQGRFLQTDSALEQAMIAIEQEPEHEAQIIVLLADIADIETKIIEARDCLGAFQVGSINLRTLYEEVLGLRNEGKRIVGQIGSILGVPRKHDIFSSWDYYSEGEYDKNYF